MGDATFVSDFNHGLGFLPIAHRFVHRVADLSSLDHAPDDFVTMVPLESQGYRHVGRYRAIFKLPPDGMALTYSSIEHADFDKNTAVSTGDKIMIAGALLNVGLPLIPVAISVAEEFSARHGAKTYSEIMRFSVTTSRVLRELQPEQHCLFKFYVLPR